MTFPNAALRFRAGLPLTCGLFFLSGASGLALQILWMYRLGLVFGNAAQAVVATLVGFFVGIAAGGRFWGRVSKGMGQPLAAYGLMEMGIGCAALLWLPGLALYEAHYPTLVSWAGGSRAFLSAGRFLFGLALLFPATFLMGGTFPVLVRFVVRGRSGLARRGTLLYAANTLGAATGALVAAFVLLPRFGVGRSYAAAVATAFGVGAVAMAVGRRSVAVRQPVTPMGGGAGGEQRALGGAPGPSEGLPHRALIGLAAASGGLTLAAETLWTRMFAQVLQNSSYSFAAVLVVFLLGLALGGGLAHMLSRAGAPRPLRVLVVLLGASAGAVSLAPWALYVATDGLQYVAPGASWPGYIGAVFLVSAGVMLPAALLMGTIFPYLLRVLPESTRQGGEEVGRLVFYNAVGAAVGPLVVGFFLLDAVGLWGGVKAVAVSYGLLGWLVYRLSEGRRPVHRQALGGLILLALAGAPEPPSVRLDQGETLRGVWEGSDGVVSVVEVDGSLQMRLDNFYALGDSRGVLVEQMQAHVPLMIHPDPRRVLFLGLGTGITAGAALEHGPDELVTVELIPNVVRAARTFFQPWTNGLFSDSRARVVADDARNYVLGTPGGFDVVVGDLFTPWHAGTGTLYTMEHFQTVRQRMAPGGVFAQWLPLWQLTPDDLHTVMATFAAVFPVATVWRADFSVERPAVALVGQAAGTRLSGPVLRRGAARFLRDASAAADSADHMGMLFYAGNLAALAEGLVHATVNTDDNRAIEMKAPVVSQRANAGSGSFVAGGVLEDLFTALSQGLPPDRDPYLADLPEHERRYAEAGRLFFMYTRALAQDRPDVARSLRARIAQTAPDFLQRLGGGG